MSHGAVGLAITAFPSVTSAHGIQRYVLWTELAARLTRFYEVSRKEDTPLWSPTLYRDANEGQKVERRAENVREMCCLVLEFDDVARGSLPSCGKQYEHVAHTTFSHIGGDALHVRMIFPFASAVPAFKWIPYHRVLGSILGGDFYDKSCSDTSRIYYWPSAHPANKRMAYHHPGALLDPADWDKEVEQWVRNNQQGALFRTRDGEPVPDPEEFFFPGSKVTM